MALSLTLMSRLCSMMLMVLVGTLAVKIGILKLSDTKAISALTVYILQPCLIFNAYQIEINKERIFGFVGCLVFGCCVYVVWIILARALRRPLHLTPVDEASLVYSNVGNLVLPLVAMTLGEEMVFYASALQVPFNLLVWSHGASTVRGENKLDIKKVITNPNMIAMLLGVISLLLRFRMPEIIATSVSSLGSMVGPMSMLMVGMVIAGKDVKTLVKRPRAYGVLFGRLLVFPMLAIVLLYLSGVVGRYPELAPILLVTVMSLSAPPASTISQLAVLYDVQPLDASAMNVLGMVFCIITMPLCIFFYQWLFL